MSPKQKLFTAKELVALAEKAGFIFSRQRGSHMIYYHTSGLRLTIPNHASRIIHPKIIKRILKDIEACKSN